MTDEAKPNSVDLGPHSTPAVISYLILTLFAFSAIGVFMIIFFGVELDPVMAGVLGTVLGATGTGYAGVQGFWLGNSSSGKQAAADIAAAGKQAQAAVAQLAGSGPPPPAAPLDPAATPEGSTDDTAGRDAATRDAAAGVGPGRVDPAWRDNPGAGA